MPLSPEDFALLQQMQTLCTELEADVKQLRQLGKVCKTQLLRARSGG